MLRFPIGNDLVLCVIGPGNIARLKEGRPLRIRFPQNESIVALVAYTPDENAFTEQLGSTIKAEKGKTHFERVHVTPEQMDAALQACLHLPEKKQ